MAKKVLIIGGGASGMMAAIFAATNGAEVTLLEKKEQLGKKLSVTGNGKCNYGNLYMAPRYYRGHDSALVESVLRRWPVERSIDWFESVGMLSVSKKNYLYPASQSASTVIHVLKKRLKECAVTVVTDCFVKSVRKEDRFIAETEKGTFYGDSLILSMGSGVAVRDENPFNGYALLEAFGHYVYPALPSLVPLLGDGTIESFWDGVRVLGTVTYKDQTEEGEIQLTKTGISGIPVFQISHAVSEDTAKRPVFLTIDFLPNYDGEALVSFLAELSCSERKEETAFDVLLGWLPKKLVTALSKREPDLFRLPLSSYAESDARRVVSTVKHFDYRVYKTAGLLEAQTVNGGVDTTEVKDTLESKLVPGLFITGELLDVDGLCGGYNLHFAFATGRISGEEAAR